MALDSLLRFGPIGTALLAVLPGIFLARYALSRPLAQRTVTSRPLDSTEQSNLQACYDTAGLSTIDTVVAVDVENNVAGLSGIPRQRAVVISESLLEAATDDELLGVAGLVAAQHEKRCLELYTGVLVATSAAFAIDLGIDPSGFHSTLIPVLLVLGLLLVPIAGFWLFRRQSFAADAAAAQTVGHAPVRAAIETIDTKKLPDWIPNRLHPKPPAEERLERLRQQE